MNVSMTVFGVAAPWLLACLGGWLVFQLVRQNGRILLNLDVLQQQLQLVAGRTHDSSPPPGLPVGQLAPDFQLPDLTGQLHQLSDYRGRRVLLIFSNPQCGFCVRMFPDLAALPADGDNGRPALVVVSTGDAERNRQLTEEHRIRCPVLLQKETEISNHYQVSGTPMGYLIDEDGNIASEQTVGSEALLQLAEESGPQTNGQNNGSAHAANGHPSAKGKASRTEGDGLKAGTQAPGFRLPRLDGGDLALEDYRGRRVLLVFSDPEGGTCVELATGLQELSRHRPDVQVVMVSRRHPDLNREKVGRLGLTFPVVLQEQMDVSRLYAKFATPIAYLIDEHGVIADDVAVGVEPILALLSGAALPIEDRAEALPGGKEVVTVGE
jgi:peroxiredoxin